ncbi:hypothetical protein [Nonomuraea sp. NPDC046570]|uniref:hypothetical protein n=1 Tax=Nonomuraea sp. NPDC046570 TaxID=3155255 RepID=UPI0033FA0974
MRRWQDQAAPPSATPYGPKAPKPHAAIVQVSQAALAPAGGRVARRWTMPMTP